MEDLSILFTRLSQRPVTMADALVFVTACVVLATACFVFIKSRQADRTLDDRVADPVRGSRHDPSGETASTSAARLDKVVAVLHGLQPLTTEIVIRNADAPGGEFDQTIRQAAALLGEWLAIQLKYIAGEGDSVARIGGANDLIAAVVMQFHDNIAPLAEYLAAHANASNPHCAKYAQFLGVLDRAIDDLPLTGPQANQRVNALRRLTTGEPPPKPRRPVPIVPSNAGQSSAIDAKIDAALAAVGANGSGGGIGFWIEPDKAAVINTALGVPFADDDGSITVVALEDPVVTLTANGELSSNGSENYGAGVFAALDGLSADHDGIDNGMVTIAALSGPPANNDGSTGQSAVAEPVAEAVLACCIAPLKGQEIDQPPVVS